MAVSDHNLIWVDMEMTGLIPEAHRVIEIATIVTDSNLTVLAEGPVLAIHQPSEALDAMDEWNTRTHTGSGLVDRVRASTVSESAAAELTLKFLRCFNDSKTCHDGRPTSGFTHRVRTPIGITPNNFYVGQRSS